MSVVNYNYFGFEVPETVYLDLTNQCNLKCIMCPQGHKMIMKKGFMSDKLFYKILNDLDSLKQKPKLAFHLIGEPFLHKHIFDYLRNAKEKGFYTFLHTNGNLLDQYKCQLLIECKIDEITFSFEGEDQHRYHQLRYGSDWNKVVSNIQYLLSLAGHPKIIIEVLKFRGIDKSLIIDKKFKNMFFGAEFCSFYASDWRGTLKDKRLTEKSEDSSMMTCKTPLKDMAIGWDGIVRGCTLDYNSECPLGDLNQENIMEIWSGKIRRNFLKKISEKKYTSIGICKDCNAPYYAHKKEHNWV